MTLHYITSDEVQKIFDTLELILLKLERLERSLNTSRKRNG